MARKKRQFRLYLINPRFAYKHYAAQREMTRLLGKKRMTIPLQLPLLAALTPEHWDVTIIDDETDELVFDPLPDLVGITTLSATWDRVSEIADQYRSRGVAVVMGGVYATFRPQHALAHADHVVVGEAEGAWQELLADFEKGEARAIYRNERVPPFERSPVPRWDLVDVASTMSVSVETSRGCPFACDFCAVNRMFGRKMRFRDVDDVIREIEACPIKRVFFVADNFALDKPYARELVRRLATLRVTWICQTSIHVADDLDLLREMAASGCAAMVIGFESLNESALKGVRKHHNRIREFERAIARVHSVGIHVWASFIVGFEQDTAETFELIYDFVERNDIVFPMLNVLSVAPGSALYERIEAAGRNCSANRAFANGIFPCMHYSALSQTEMLDRFFGTVFRMFAWNNVADRALRLFSTGAFAMAGNEDVPAKEKVLTLALLTRRYLLSPNSAKRRIFVELVDLVRSGKLAADKAVLFMLNIEAFNEFFDEARGYLGRIRSEVATVDRGPWTAISGRSGETIAVERGCGARRPHRGAAA